MKLQEFSLLLPILGLSPSQVLCSTQVPSASSEQCSDSMRYSSGVLIPPDPLAALSLSELSAPAAHFSLLELERFKDSTLPVALEALGPRDDQGRSQPVSRWKAEQISAVIDLLKNSEQALLVLEERYKGSLLIVQQDPSDSEKITYLESLAGIHVFAQLGCYAGLSNREISTLVAYIHALSDFGEQKQSGQRGWLQLSEKAHQKMSKRVLSRVDKPQQDGLSDAILESLILLELYEDAKDLFLQRRGRAPALKQEGTELLYDLVRRKYFLDKPAEQSTYMTACRDITECTEERHELGRQFREEGKLSKQKQRRLEHLDAKISEAEKMLGSLEEGLAPLLHEQVDELAALKARIERMEKYAPLSEIRRKMNTPERDS